MVQKIRLLCLIVISFLVGCTESELPILRVGTNIWPGYEPLYLARQQGYLKEDKVQLVELSSASQVIQAFRNGVIDAAALTLDEVLLLLESGEDVEIILVMDVSHGADSIVGQSELAGLEELSGKRIGVENNALGAYIVSRALEISNINRQSVYIVPLEIHEQETSFLQEKLDAVVTFEPVLSRLVNSGGRILFDSRQIPNEIVDVLIVKREFLGRYSERVEYLRNAWFKALAYKDKQPREAAKVLGVRMKLDVTETLATYEGLRLPDNKENQQLLYGNPEPGLLSTANKLNQVMVDQGLISSTVNPSLLFSNIMDKD